MDTYESDLSIIIGEKSQRESIHGIKHSEEAKKRRVEARDAKSHSEKVIATPLILISGGGYQCHTLSTEQ